MNNENEDNERRISNTQGTMRNMKEKLENNQDIFLISPGQYNKPINDPRNLDVLKFLVRLVILLTIMNIFLLIKYFQVLIY